MLYTQGNDLTRIQCAFVDTPEVERIATYIGGQRGYADAHILPEYIGEEKNSNIDIDIISINDPPTFKDFVSTSSIDENTLNVLSVTAEDVEYDTIGYSLSGNDAEKLSISTSGAITFKTNPDFENPTDTNSDNSY